MSNDTAAEDIKKIKGSNINNNNNVNSNSNNNNINSNLNSNVNSNNLVNGIIKNSKDPTLSGNITDQLKEMNLTSKNITLKDIEEIFSKKLKEV